MRSVPTFLSIAALASASLITSTWVAADNQLDGQPLPERTSIQLAHATPAKQGMGMRAGATMPGYAEQMNALQELRDRMHSATTPEERNAVMAEQMELMQNGMNMMGGMGAGARMGNRDDMPVRQDLMEQRMDMMQSMMQLMMDRMESLSETK